MCWLASNHSPTASQGFLMALRSHLTMQYLYERNKIFSKGRSLNEKICELILKLTAWSNDCAQTESIINETCYIFKTSYQ